MNIGMKPDIFTFIDLEMNQPSGKIIQLGAVVGNIRTGEILERLSVFVNPNEQLNPFIIDLTGISQEQVDSGVTLKEMYDSLYTLHKKHGSFRNFGQWGGGDSKCIKDALGMDDESFVGGRRELDVKTIFIGWRLSQGEKIQSGLAKSLIKLGLAFEGKKHNALSDAENTFRIFMALLGKYKA